ncbi:MAG TPA: hypothetical protein PK819_05465 [Thermomicrobiales bacterium]|nr:hypothetical protein [Thermomicrobiales bacterium]
MDKTIIKRGLGIAGCGLLLVATPVLARHDDHLGPEYGAYINVGTCEEISDQVVADIGDLEKDEHVWKVVGQGLKIKPDPIYGEDEEIDQTIEELTASDHVVVIRADDDVTAAVIACGAISGKADAKGELMVALDEVDDSGFEGRAHFGPNHDDDDHEPVEVTTGVWKVGAAGTPVASPEATPSS